MIIYYGDLLKFILLNEVTMTNKKPKNHGKSWTEKDIRELRKLAKGNTPTRVIGLKMGRTEGAVYTAANQNDISLKPVNQSPYNRKKK